MNYNSIEQLEHDFTQGKIQSLPEEISISGVMYKLLKSSQYALSDMINKTLKGIVLYNLVKSPENVELYKKLHHTVEDSKMQDRIALIWTFNKMNLYPLAARFISSARSEPMLSAGIVHEANISNERMIGHNTSIILSGFNNGDQIPAKVDTGAHISSLHATNIEHKPGQNMVSFIFGNKRYTMPAVEVQAIQTADNGVENRPVVVFDVIVPMGDVNTKNKIVKKVKFNLNDRSSMPDKILLGQNFIKGGDFVVVSDEEVERMYECHINWGELQEELTNIAISEEYIVQHNINQLQSLLDTMVKK